MGRSSAFLYHDDFLKYQFGPFHPFQPIREKITMDGLESLGVFDGEKANIVTPEPADRQAVALVHSDRYIDFVIKMSEKGNGLLDFGDTPATHGLYEGSLAAVGGSISGASGIAQGEFDHAFNPAGGLHHAHPDHASGFCVFNDVAVAVRSLQRHFGLDRIAVIDIDGHHGDGTQFVFYEEPILTISMHRYGFGFFPGSGSEKELGEGEGLGYNMNVPMPVGTTDDQYLRAFTEVVVPALKTYKPQFILHQFGVDGHYADPLVGLGLTTRGYEKIVSITHDLSHQLCNGKYMVVGGGGYNIDAVRRSWSVMFCTLSQSYPSQDQYLALHDQQRPQPRKENGERVEEVVGYLKNEALPLLKEKATA
jgi:acetoin utilization protein AcuC